MDGIQHATPHAFQIAPRPQGGIRQRVLTAHVLGTAALHQQRHRGSGAAALRRNVVDHRRPVTGVGVDGTPRDGIDRVTAEPSLLRRDGDRLLHGGRCNKSAQPLIHEERQRAGILAHRRALPPGEGGVLHERLQNHACGGTFRLATDRRRQRLQNIRRQPAGGPPDKPRNFLFNLHDGKLYHNHRLQLDDILYKVKILVLGGRPFPETRNS